MFSIIEFCQYCRISRSFFYLLQRQGKGPALTRIGARVLIARDTVDEWLKSREETAWVAPVLAQSQVRRTGTRTGGNPPEICVSKRTPTPSPALARNRS